MVGALPTRRRAVDAVRVGCLRRVGWLDAGRRAGTRERAGGIMGGADKTLTGLAGRFYVLGQLAQRGLVGEMTPSTTKAVDIRVSIPDLERVCKIQVKATVKPARRLKLFGDEPFFAWPMGKKHEEITDPLLFYCFVILRGTEERPRFFVVPSADVAEYVRWEHQHWLDSRSQAVSPTSMRNFRIQISDPKGYEDDWDCLGRT